MVDGAEGSTSLRRRRALRIVRDVASIAVAGALIAWLLPRVAGASWSEILAPMQALPAGALIGFAALQLTALWFVAYAIAGSLPGLSHTRALSVNLAGSFIANTVPFGGAVAVGVTYGMCRSWGFGRGEIGISVVLGGIWNSAAKIVLPIVGLLALVAQGAAIDGRIQGALVSTVAVLLVVLAAFVAMLVSPRLARSIGRFAQRLAELALRGIRRPRVLRWDEAVARLHEQTRDVVRRGWAAMTFGTIGYHAVYFVLFWLCLASVGVSVNAGVLLAAFALGRLLTSVAVTPGGLGLVEAGSLALLVALGAPPAAAASGILLFTIFTHLIEIPFGAIAWLIFLFRRGRKEPDLVPAGTDARAPAER